MLAENDGHAAIAELKVNDPTKKDYLIMNLFIKQKSDKYVGVAFGRELEKTYKAAKKKVENLPRLNIWIPVVEVQENTDYANKGNSKM